MRIILNQDISNDWKKQLTESGPVPLLHQPVDIERTGRVARHYLNDLPSLRKTLSSGEGYIIFSGLPQDNVIPTPPRKDNELTGKTRISESVLLGVTEAIGFHPFSYREEKNGVLVHDVTPFPEKINAVSSNGIKAFPWHTDAAYLNRNIRPATLSLYCLNNQARSGTRLAAVDEILRQLSENEISILTTARFLHHAPETFTVKKEQVIASVLDRVDGCYELKLSSHNIEPLTPEAKNALNALLSAMDNVAITHEWHPGDMVIFSNTRCVHARGNIEGKRWLQRCYGSSTISPGSILNADSYLLG